MDRYSLQKARRYVVHAFTKLNKMRGSDLALLNLEYTDMMGLDFIKASMWDKASQSGFSALLNENIFTEKSAMTVLDTNVGILGKNFSAEERITLRTAYVIWKSWKDAGGEDVDLRWLNGRIKN